MIKLDVAEYCANCPYFSPESESVTLHTPSDEIITTTVQCKNKEKCNLICEYLSNKLKHIEVSITDRDIELLKNDGHLCCEVSGDMSEIRIFHGEEESVEDD